MTKSYYIFWSLFFISVFAFPSQRLSAQCSAKHIMKACKPNVSPPYIYDSYVTSELTFDAKPHVIEVVFTAFAGQKYKLVFCSSGFGEQVKLDIYNKPLRMKAGRKKLYDSDQGIDSDFWTFEPSIAGKYYINYEVSPSLDGKQKKGCIVLLVSYVEDKK